MGLGKTMQCAAFLAGLFHSRLIRCTPAWSASGLLRAQDKLNACMHQRHSHAIQLSHILTAQGLTARALVRRRALVVAPKTLLAHWAAELRGCGLERLVAEFYGGSVRDRCATFCPKSDHRTCLHE